MNDSLAARPYYSRRWKKNQFDEGKLFFSMATKDEKRLACFHLPNCNYQKDTIVFIFSLNSCNHHYFCAKKHFFLLVQTNREGLFDFIHVWVREWSKSETRYENEYIILKVTYPMQYKAIVSQPEISFCSSQPWKRPRFLLDLPASLPAAYIPSQVFLQPNPSPWTDEWRNSIPPSRIFATLEKSFNCSTLARLWW